MQSCSRGRHHAQRIDREVADRDRDRHQSTRRQGTQVAGDRLDAEGGGIGVGGVQEVGGDVDHVPADAVILEFRSRCPRGCRAPPPLEGGGWGEGLVGGRHRPTPPPTLGPLRGPSPQGEGEDLARSAARPCRGNRTGIRQSHARIAAPRRRRPQALLQCSVQQRLRFQHAHLRRTERQQFGDAEPARSARQQHPRVRHQRIGQRIQCGSRIPRDRSGRLRQGRDAVAVAIQAEAARRALDAQQAGVVGDVGVHPLGEVVEQAVVATGRVHLGQSARARRLQWCVDRLELVHRGLVVQHQQCLAGQQRQSRGGGAAPAEPRWQEQCAGRQRHQQQRHQEERVHREHRRQHQRRARARAGQVVAVNHADARCVQHEAQADEQSGEEEERQQRRIVAGDIPKLVRPGRRVLQLQWIERIGRRQVKADRGAGHQQRRQHRHQPRTLSRQRVTPQRQHDAGQREPDHDDGDHPVAVFRPRRDGKITRQRGLKPHRRQRDEEQRPQAHGQIRRRMKLASKALNRPASSTNNAWPASANNAVSVFGRLACRLSAWAAKLGRTTYSTGLAVE